MKKTVISIIIFSFFSKFLGFSRDIVLSYFYGTSDLSDIYLISLTVPSVIYGILNKGIVTSYIPMQSKKMYEDGKRESDIFTSNFINIILFCTIIVLIIGLIFTEQLLNIVAIGFSGEQLDLAIKFTRIALFSILITPTISILSGYLQLNNNYIIPAFIGVPLNIIIVMSIFFASKFNDNFLAIGTLIATLSQLFLIIPYTKKKGFIYTPLINLKDTDMLRTLKITFPIIIGSSINELNIMLDRSIASSLESGSISALNYANHFNSFVQGLFVASIITVMYPLISKYYNLKDKNEFKKSINESIGMITFIVTPISFGIIVFSVQIVDMLFGRGVFDDSALAMTSTTLYYYAFGMLGIGVREVLSRAFYAMQNTKIPLLNAGFVFFFESNTEYYFI